MNYLLRQSPSQVWARTVDIYLTADNRQMPLWWRVELLQNYVIHKVIIYNRVDAKPSRGNKFKKQFLLVLTNNCTPTFKYSFIDSKYFRYSDRLAWSTLSCWRYRLCYSNSFLTLVHWREFNTFVAIYQKSNFWHISTF